MWTREKDCSNDQLYGGIDPIQASPARVPTGRRRSMTWRRDLKSPTGNKRGTVRIRQFERVDSLDSVVACIAFPL